MEVTPWRQTPTQRNVKTIPLEEQIQRRAYELYVQRGGTSGSELADWLQAESEILMAREDETKERGS